MKLRKSLLAVFGATIVSTLLFASSVDAGRVYVHPRFVVIHKGHVHSVRCGHYFYRNNWYFLKGHVHNRYCGHVLIRGVWTIR